MNVYFFNLITLIFWVTNLQAALPLSEIPETTEYFSSVVFAAAIRPLIDSDLAQGLEVLKRTDPDYASFSVGDYEKHLISGANGLIIPDDRCTYIAILLCNIQTQSGQELKTIWGSFFENIMKILCIHKLCNQLIVLKTMELDLRGQGLKIMMLKRVPVYANNEMPNYFPSIVLVEAVKIQRNFEIFKEFKKIQEEEEKKALELMKNFKVIKLKYTRSSFEDYKKSRRPEEAKKVFSDDLCSYVATVLYHVHKMAHPSQDFILKVLNDTVRNLRADDSSYDRIVNKNFELQSAEPRV